MKKVFLMSLMILGAAFVSNAQLNKLEAEAFFKSYPTAGLTITVYTDMVSGDENYKWYTKKIEIESGANTIVFGERAMTIKTTTGDAYLVVYDKIKTLEYYAVSKSVNVEVLH